MSPSPPPRRSTSSPAPPTSSLKAHFASLPPTGGVAHLADNTSHPIMTTAPDAVSRNALTALSSAYLSAHDTASRMGLGLPVRVTVTSGRGTTVVQTATEPEGAGGEPAADSSGTREIVVGTVAAPEERIAEARVASWAVEESARRVLKVIAEGRRGQ